MPGWDDQFFRHEELKKKHCYFITWASMNHNSTRPITYNVEIHNTLDLPNTRLHNAFSFLGDQRKKE
jgi:hypothetical protein